MHANDGHPDTTELFNGINSVLTHLTHHSMFGIIKSTNLLQGYDKKKHVMFLGIQKGDKYFFKIIL